jgi:hypothetical protein
MSSPRALLATVAIALSGCNLIAYDLTANGRDLSHAADAGVEHRSDGGTADAGDNTDAGPTDPCEENNGGCATNAVCASSEAGVSCTCPNGYKGDGTTYCDDVEECLTDHGGCDVNATCTNLPGSYRCDCKAGYEGNGTSCADINECTTNNGGCVAEAACTNTEGGRTCECIPGYTGNGEFECWQQNWSQVGVLPAKRANHAGALDGDRLYLTGGVTSGTISSDVWMTELKSTGGVTPVASLLKMPGARMNHCSVVVGNHLYVLGGTMVGFNSQWIESEDVQIGLLKSDGSVDSWGSTTMPVGRTRIACAAVGDRIYVVGGSVTVNTQPWSVAETLYTTVDTVTGNLGTWQTTSELPDVRAGLAIGVVGDTFYVSGGQNTQGQHMTQTYFAKVQSDGALSAWTATSAPTIGLYGARHFVLGNKLYVLGAGAQVATVQSDGSLSSWTDVTPAYEQGWWRNHHVVVGHGGRAFVAGGVDYNGGAYWGDLQMQALP